MLKVKILFLLIISLVTLNYVSAVKIPYNWQIINGEVIEMDTNNIYYKVTLGNTSYITINNVLTNTFVNEHYEELKSIYTTYSEYLLGNINEGELITELSKMGLSVKQYHTLYLSGTGDIFIVENEKIKLLLPKGRFMGIFKNISDENKISSIDTTSLTNVVIPSQQLSVTVYISDDYSYVVVNSNNIINKPVPIVILTTNGNIYTDFIMNKGKVIKVRGVVQKIYQLNFLFELIDIDFNVKSSGTILYDGTIIDDNGVHSSIFSNFKVTDLNGDITKPISENKVTNIDPNIVRVCDNIISNGYLLVFNPDNNKFVGYLLVKPIIRYKVEDVNSNYKVLLSTINGVSLESLVDVSYDGNVQEIDYSTYYIGYGTSQITLSLLVDNSIKGTLIFHVPKSYDYNIIRNNSNIYVITNKPTKLLIYDPREGTYVEEKTLPQGIVFKLEPEKVYIVGNEVIIVKSPKYYVGNKMLLMFFVIVGGIIIYYYGYVAKGDIRLFIKRTPILNKMIKVRENKVVEDESTNDTFPHGDIFSIHSSYIPNDYSIELLVKNPRTNESYSVWVNFYNDTGLLLVYDPNKVNIYYYNPLNNVKLNVGDINKIEDIIKESYVNPYIVSTNNTVLMDINTAHKIAILLRSIPDIGIVKDYMSEKVKHYSSKGVNSSRENRGFTSPKQQVLPIEHKKRSSSISEQVASNKIPKSVTNNDLSPVNEVQEHPVNKQISSGNDNLKQVNQNKEEQTKKPDENNLEKPFNTKPVMVTEDDEEDIEQPILD